MAPARMGTTWCRSEAPSGRRRQWPPTQCQTELAATEKTESDVSAATDLCLLRGQIDARAVAGPSEGATRAQRRVGDGVPDDPPWPAATRRLPGARLVKSNVAAHLSAAQSRPPPIDASFDGVAASISPG